MKKIYTLMFVMLVALFGASASHADDVTIVLNIDNPEALICQVNYEDVDLVAGNNTFSLQEYGSITLRAIPPYALVSITNAAGSPQGFYDNTWYFYANSYNAGTYTVVTKNLDEARTASCTVNVDDADRVSAVLAGTSSRVALVNGSNTVKFDPTTETSLSISSAVYNMPLYAVTLNGEPVAAEGGAYNVPLTQDCQIDITAIIPEKDVTITFVYSEDGQGAISSVTVDGTPVEDFNGLTVATKSGKSIGFNSNPMYNIESVKIDGQHISWTGGYSYNTTILDDMTVEVTAHPYGTVSATVIVEDPTTVKLYRGYSYQNDLITLVAGSNTVELSENNPYVSWEAAAGCLINSVTLNGDLLDSYTTGTNLADGDVLQFNSSKITMDKTAVVWIDNRAAATQYFSFQSADRNEISIADGYNIIDFYSGMSPFGLSWYSENPLVGKVFVNDLLMNPLYEGGSSYQVGLDNQDVLKIFLSVEPVECNVTFNVAQDAACTVTRDVIVPVTDFTSSFTALNGTQILVTPEDGANLSVSVNDEPVAAGEDGAFKVIVNDPSTLIAIEKDSSAIDTVGTDASSSSAPVYNLQGICVGRASALGTLPAGIYIVDGKKVMVK